MSTLLINADDFTIRRLTPTPAELDAVLAVYRQCEDFLALGPVPTASMPMVLADLELSKEEGGIFCGIYDRQTGEMMGIVDFVLSGFEGDPHLAFLSLLMIAAPHRGHSLGARVVKVVEDEIRRDGRAHAIRSGVQVNNPQAVRFWQRMGYQIISGPELLPDTTTCYRLWKWLDHEHTPQTAQ